MPTAGQMIINKAFSFSSLGRKKREGGEDGKKTKTKEGKTRINLWWGQAPSPPGDARGLLPTQSNPKLGGWTEVMATARDRGTHRGRTLISCCPPLESRISNWGPRADQVVALHPQPGPMAQVPGSGSEARALPAFALSWPEPPGGPEVARQTGQRGLEEEEEEPRL